MLRYIKETLKIDFITCKIKKNGYNKNFEFILTDGTIHEIPVKNVLYTLNNRHSKIQFDMVSLCRYLILPIANDNGI